MASVQTLDEEFEEPESIDDTDDGNTGEDSDLHIETNWIEQRFPFQDRWVYENCDLGIIICDGINVT